MHSTALQDRLRSQTHAFQNARLTDYGSLNMAPIDSYTRIPSYQGVVAIGEGLGEALLEQVFGEAEGHAFETQRFQPLRF